LIKRKTTHTDILYADSSGWNAFTLRKIIEIILERKSGAQNYQHIYLIKPILEAFLLIPFIQISK